MRIGQLARATGVSTDTLRFYEARGLIRSTRRSNGYREYPSGTVDLVGYVRTAQRLGFSLAEAAASLSAVWNAPNRDAAVVELLMGKIAAIEERISDLTALRDELAARLAGSCPLRRTETAAHHDHQQASQAPESDAA